MSESNESPVFNESVPEIPDDYVGVQDDKVSETKGRRNSGPLAPEYGGTGDAETDFENLTGGTGRPDSNNPDRIVGENGVGYRPNANGGPRIDIPAKGNKKSETLHY